MVGYDECDDYTAAAVIEGQGSPYTDALQDADLLGRRIGVLRQAFGDDSDPDGAEVNKAIAAALIRLRDGGAELLDIVIENLDDQVGFTSLYTTRSQSDMNEFVQARPDAGVPSMRHLIETSQYHEKLNLLEAIVAGPEDPTEDHSTLHACLRRLHSSDKSSASWQPTDWMPSPSLTPNCPHRPETTYSPTGGPASPTRPTPSLLPSCCSLPSPFPQGKPPKGLPVGLELMGIPYGERRLISLAAASEGVLQARTAPEF